MPGLVFDCKVKLGMLWHAANEVITLGIMLVHIVLHVHPMPVIKEFELNKLNSFRHGRISYKHGGFHYISYILQLKRGALEV